MAIGPDDVVRVFSGRADGASVLLGPSSATFALPANAAHGVDEAHLAVGDVVLGVEGLEFAAEVKLIAELFEPGGGVFHSDQIQLKVAPLILLHHLQPPTDSYVSQVTTGLPRKKWTSNYAASDCTRVCNSLYWTGLR